MPVARFQLPDGRIGRFEVPEGTTPEQAQEMISQSLSEKPGTAQTEPSAAPTVNKKNVVSSALNAVPGGALLSAVGEPLAKLATGIVAKPVAEVAGMAAALKDYFTGNKDGDIEGFKSEVSDRLTYSPRTSLGDSGVNPLNAIPELIGRGVNAAVNLPANAIEGDGASPYRTAAANFLREAVPQGLGFIGVKGAKSTAPAEALAAKESQALARTKAQKPVRDIVEASRAEGLKIPPSSVNPSAGNRVAERIAGKTATEDSVSISNAPIINKIGQRVLGVADDTPLLPEVFDEIRAKAGKPYEELKGVGHFSADRKFTKIINEIEAETKSTGNFETIKNKGVDEVVSDLKKGNFDSVDAVRLMKKLRAKANKNIESLDPEVVELSRAQKKGAKALEELVDRNLADADKYFPGHDYSDIAKRFKAGREMIAKSYNLQKATDPATGAVDVRKLAAAARSGKKFTGDLKLLADFGQTFSKAAKPVASIGSPVGSPVISSSLAGTFLSALGYSVLGPGGIALGLAPSVRPITRGAILTPGLQRLLAKPPDPSVGALTRAAYSSAPAASGLAGLIAPSASERESRKGRK